MRDFASFHSLELDGILISCYCFFLWKGSPTKKSREEEEVTLTQEEQEEALKELFAASDTVEEGVEEVVRPCAQVFFLNLFDDDLFTIGTGTADWIEGLFVSSSESGFTLA